MKPVGLIFKDAGSNLFTNNSGGEPMIVHVCLGCGRVSPNRIAGDDNSYSVACLLQEPNSLGEQITAILAGRGIKLLCQEDEKEVLTCLYGFDYLKCIV